MGTSAIGLRNAPTLRKGQDIKAKAKAKASLRLAKAKETNGNMGVNRKAKVLGKMVAKMGAKVKDTRRPRAGPVGSPGTGRTSDGESER